LALFTAWMKAPDEGNRIGSRLAVMTILPLKTSSGLLPASPSTAASSTTRKKGMTIRDLFMRETSKTGVRFNHQTSAEEEFF
jgi:hypothetical protein